MNSYNVTDAYALMNEVVSQSTGRSDLAVVDTTTFTTVGETILRTGTENALKSISAVCCKTIFSVRPYTGKLESIKVASEKWGGMVRKIVNLYSEAEKSDNHNTDITPNQLADGESIDMYKIRSPKVLQLNFYGTKVLQRHITRFQDQLSIAFHDEVEFLRFIDDIMIEFANEIELTNEAQTRATVLNFMAGISAMGLTEVDLVAEYNNEYSTNYTRGELLSTHLTSFMQFVASTVKTYSSILTDMSTQNHANIDGYEKIPRHTPKERQKMLMYEPIFIKTQASVYSSLFNPSYLDIGKFEGVNYWQSQKTPTAINVKPNILDTATGESKNHTTAVELDYVLGLLFDDEALGVCPQFSYTSTTPFNSAGEYYNVFAHWRFNSFCDYTENAILFILGEGGV